MTIILPDDLKIKELDISHKELTILPDLTKYTKLEKLYWTDMIWLLWEILKSLGDWNGSSSLKEIIDKSYRFYVYYYNKKNRYKKINLVIYCFMFFIKPVDFINIYGSPENYSKILLAGGNVNSLYKYLETK